MLCKGGRLALTLTSPLPLVKTWDSGWACKVLHFSCVMMGRANVCFYIWIMFRHWEQDRPQVCRWLTILRRHLYVLWKDPADTCLKKLCYPYCCGLKGTWCWDAVGMPSKERVHFSPKAVFIFTLNDKACSQSRLAAHVLEQVAQTPSHWWLWKSKD